MRETAACAGFAILLVIIVGVRTAARELVAPIDGFERIVRSKPTLNVEIDPAAKAEPPVEEVNEWTPDSSASLEAIKGEMDELVALQSPVTRGQFRISRQTTLTESQRTMLAEWDRWKSQAIAELPEIIRADSDHRKAIEETYARACGAFIEAGQLAEVLEEMEVSLQLVGFTDIDEQTEASFVTPESARLETYDLRAPSAHPTLMRLSWGSFPIGEHEAEVTRE